MVNPYFSEMDEFCVAVERLLRRILTDEDWDDPDITRMARWFSLWFNSLGMELGYVYEVNKQDYDGDGKQNRWRVSLYHHQFHDRSYFYVFDDSLTAEGFVDRLHDLLKTVKGREESLGTSSYEDVRSIATSIHCFLNEHPDAENTFELFAEKFTTG